MMNNFIQELKNAWNKADNALIQLIYVNIAVFAVLIFFKVISHLTKTDIIYDLVFDQFSISQSPIKTILKPWTLVTYAISHNINDIFGIIINMMIFYWFGKFIVDYIGNDKLISLYVLGALGGAVLFLVSNIILTGGMGRAILSSSRPAVFAIVAAAATLIPNHSIHLFIIGEVKIKYVAIVYVAYSVLTSFKFAPGFSLAYLGGAAIGYIYVTQLKKGTDLGGWIIDLGRFIRSFFVKTDPIKVSHRNKDRVRKKETVIQDADVLPNQDEIDSILDKIAASGYDSLTKEEKQKLFNASKK